MALEAGELHRAVQALPSESSLLAMARHRVSAELRALPPYGSPAWRAAMLAERSAGGVSLGALAHAIRAATALGQTDDARELFVSLLRRIDGLNRRWVAKTLWSLAIAGPERYERAQDLAQDLTLLLWEQIGLREDEAWELFFQRALAFAQSHVATAHARRHGLRTDPRARQSERGLAIVFSRLTAETGDDDAGSIEPDPADSAAFSQAELADLRTLVLRLPDRERLAVVMRFWQQASEAEIALALGGVTTRAVRYMLTRAYRRLGAWYTGEDDVDTSRETNDDR